MKRIMIACIAVAAFAAPAFAQSQGPVNNNTLNASPVANERSFNLVDGANAFGGRSQGAFGAAQSDVVGQINDGTAINGVTYDNYGALLHDFCGSSNCGAK